MLFQNFNSDLTHQVLFLYILSSNHINLRDQPFCRISAKVSLILENPFPFPSPCKLNHNSVCFIHISPKITCKQLIPFRESYVFWSDLWCFGLLGTFQLNIEISIKTARVSRLSFRFLWLSWNQITLEIFLFEFFFSDFVF